MEFNKLLITLRYYMLGAKYYKALKALDIARSYHRGFRKDGKTPELQHQVEMCLYATTLKDLINEELTLGTILLHDTLEDYPQATYEEIEKACGFEIADRCLILNKNGKTYDKYFRKIGEDCIASIVKGTDRIHNVNSMLGVFSKEKQRAYVEEVDKYFLPMLKVARNSFPEQMQAYFNISFMLRSQANLLKESFGEKS